MLELKNIKKNYGNKTILDNINLSINTGEITFIVGTSGAGKTTLLNILGGLDKPSSGNFVFNGKDIGNDLSTYRAKNIGFVFQDFNLISGLSVVQNVEIATEISGIKKDIDEIISEVKSLGISDPHQKVETLSGGEKQRVAVIRSICKDVDILITDEPTGNLDSSNADLVLDMLQSLKADKHIIIVSHDIQKARKYADRIIKLSDGNIVSDEMLCNDKGNSTEFKITGINHTKNPFDETYSFISSDSLKDMLSRIMEENVFQRQELMTYYTEIQRMTTGGLYGSMSPVDEKMKLLYGKHPILDENVLISSELLKNTMSYFNIEKNYSYDEIIAGKISSQDVNSIFLKN